MTKYDELQWFQDGQIEVARFYIAGQEVEVSKVSDGASWYALVGTLDPSSPKLARSVDPDEKTAVLDAIAKAEKALTKK
jgi:hypothetical protein